MDGDGAEDRSPHRGAHAPLRHARAPPFVMPERPPPSCPDLFRVSMRPFGAAKVDARNESGHDEETHDGEGHDERRHDGRRAVAAGARDGSCPLAFHHARTPSPLCLDALSVMPGRPPFRHARTPSLRQPGRPLRRARTPPPPCPDAPLRHARTPPPPCLKAPPFVMPGLVPGIHAAVRGSGGRGCPERVRA